MSDQEFLKWIGRHCVAVVWQDKLDHEADASGGTAFSAFVIEVSGQVVLVTAGHIVEILHNRQKVGRKNFAARIYDSWSLKPVTKDGISFADIGDTQQGFVHSEDLGLDYLWFSLRPHHVELLKANNIIPFTVAAWENPPPMEDFIGFNCFGFPDEINVERRDPNGKFIGMVLKPRLVPYQPAKPHDDLARTKYPRLFFMPTGSPDGNVPELAGMSGGPVFGYTKKGNDLRYWLLGVQSGQAENPPRVATVCPFPPLAKLISEEITNAKQVELPHKA